jgi:hypothetical protein
VGRTVSDLVSKTEVAEWRAPAARVANLVTFVQSASHDLVPHARYQLTRLGPAGVIGAAACVAAAIILTVALISLRTANDRLSEQILRAQHRHAPSITPEQGLTRVVAQLPARAQMPAVLGQILQHAHAAGIELEKGQYSYSAATKGEIARYEADFPVTAPYPVVRDFIDRILTNIPAAGLQKLTIQRKVVADAQVNADVRFVIFVRDR